jgi:hypothetical protein
MLAYDWRRTREAETGAAVSLAFGWPPRLGPRLVARPGQLGRGDAASMLEQRQRQQNNRRHANSYRSAQSETVHGLW